MIPVKICGITNLEDAQAALRSGATAIGFIFYDKSPRYIHLETAIQIAADVNGKVSLVGVFVNESLDYVRKISEEIGLNFIQLHGNESPEYCQQINLPVIKVFRVSPDFNISQINSYNVHALLFDSYKKNNPGGTGKVLNWDKIANLQIDSPIILSGGLSVENIEDSIEAVSPSAVDVNSGVELSPGIRDEKKMIALFDIIKNTRSLSNPFQIPIAQGNSHDL